jgi:hypothetical protein
MKNENVFLSGNYQLINVYNQPDLLMTLKDEIIDLWLKNNALNYSQAVERVNSVVYVIQEKYTQQITGVNTARLNYLPNTLNLYYFYGMFIDVNHRGTRPWLLKRTYNLLNKNRLEKKARGLAAVLENKKIPHKLFHRYNWTRFNYNHTENAIFYKDFDI